MRVPAQFALPPFEAVILDMDGLVLDTESAYIDAWRRAAMELGREISEEFCAGLMGKEAEHVRAELEQAMGAEFDFQHFYPLAERFWREHIRQNGIPHMPGLAQLMAQLRKFQIPYAMATNSRREYAIECLQIADAAELFPCVVCRDDVARGKPEPDVILEAANRLGVRPGACLVLEDSETGLKAAARAGSVPVLVNRSTTTDRVKGLAVAHFGCLDELLIPIAERCFVDSPA